VIEFEGNLSYLRSDYKDVLASAVNFRF